MTGILARVGKKWVQVAAIVGVVLVAAVAVAVAGKALGGSDGPTSQADYQASVVNARDRTDFALGRLSQAKSLEELLTRMDEAAVTIDGAAGELDKVTPPDEFTALNARLVKQLKQLSNDVQGTADQARQLGFENLLSGADGLSFDSWDRVNAVLAELNEKGITVEPLSRHTTDQPQSPPPTPS